MEHGVAYDVDAVDFTPDASAEKLSELVHYESEAKAAASSVEDILVPPKSVGVQDILYAYCASPPIVPQLFALVDFIRRKNKENEN